jgi:hypothetical protein
VVEIDGANNMGGTVQVNYQFGVAPVTAITTTQSMIVGRHSSFTLTADIANGAQAQPGYQWYLNGKPIQGATGTNYTDASAQFGDTGTYTVVAANLFGSTGPVTVAQVVVLISPLEPTLSASVAGGALNLSVTGLTLQAIVSIYNSSNLAPATWNLLTNSTNSANVWNLAIPTNLLPPPQFFKAVEH